MITTKYGTLSSNQLLATKQYIRKQIYYLLLYVDPKTSYEYPNVDVTKAFIGLQYKLCGLSSLLFDSPYIVTVMSLLEAALLEYQKEDFNYSVYRKLILDAGNEINKLRDVRVNFNSILKKCDEIEKSLIRA